MIAVKNFQQFPYRELELLIRLPICSLFHVMGLLQTNVTELRYIVNIRAFLYPRNKNATECIRIPIQQLRKKYFQC